MTEPAETSQLPPVSPSSFSAVSFKPLKAPPFASTLSALTASLVSPPLTEPPLPPPFLTPAPSDLALERTRTRKASCLQSSRQASTLSAMDSWRAFHEACHRISWLLTNLRGHIPCVPCASAAAVSLTHARRIGRSANFSSTPSVLSRCCSKSLVLRRRRKSLGTVSRIFMMSGKYAITLDWSFAFASFLCSSTNVIVSSIPSDRVSVSSSLGPPPPPRRSFFLFSFLSLFRLALSLSSAPFSPPSSISAY
mmetsp:Transcript_28201/g.55221  ORF Transcript_28201/g.55221 Transcript_28201/m.55221 type:complete len:251 (-) Transcript_28201:270-1022(-)